jgi:hypothetical protein
MNDSEGALRNEFFWKHAICHLQNIAGRELPRKFSVSWLVSQFDFLYTFCIEFKWNQFV